MLSAIELRVEQKRRLYQLLAIRESEKKTFGSIDPVLEEFIFQTIAEMEEQDVAYVEKQIARRR